MSTVATRPPPEVTEARPVHLVPVLAFVAAHAPIAFAMRSSPALATAQAGLTVAATLWVLLASRTPGPLVAVAAYIAGCEVLWRQTGASVPWEVAKYLLLVVFAVGTYRFVGRRGKWGISGVFLAALAPAAVVPLVKLGVLGALDPISFNLGGLVVLAVGVLFLSRVAGPWTSVTPALWAFVAPAVGTAALAANGVIGLRAADFFNDSNIRSSGGFGPNQVSAVLGLGALFLVLIAVKDARPSLRVSAIVIGLWFTTQALLTFSRGGVVNLVAGVVFGLPFLLRRRETAIRVIGLTLVIGLLGALLVLPALNHFTGGALDRRYSRDRESERRIELMAMDYETFVDHPALGVGVGESEYYRLERRLIAAHTEYTRLLAEHGVLGIVVLVCFGWMAVAAFRRQVGPTGQAWAVSLVAWTASALAHSATRLAAVALVFALAQITVVDPPEAQRTPRGRARRGTRGRRVELSPR